MSAAGVFQMYVPRELGGLEIHPLTFIQAVMAIAAEDGSAGWNAMICGVQGVYLSRLERPQAEEILASGTAGIAGSFNPAEGRATVEGDGYRLSGHWRFASGCHQALWMMAPAVVVDGAGAPLRDEMGQPLTRIALVPKEHCTILDTWDVGGLRGTDSNDFTLDGRLVPGAFTFDRAAPGQYAGPLYRLPILLAFGPGVASTCLGIARGAITEFQRLGAEKRPTSSTGLLRERVGAQLHAAEAEALVESARLFLMDGVGAMFRCAEAGETPSLDVRMRQRLAAWNASRSAARAVRLIYEQAGTSALYATNPLERAFRDVHAAGQHMAVGLAVQEAAGRVVLGMDPGSPLI